MNNTTLDQIYAATTYWLYADSLTFGLRIGEILPAFEDWCVAKAIHSWAMLTAANPYSQELSLEENFRRNALLVQQLQLLGFQEYYPAEGKPDTGTWSPEPGFFIPHLMLSQALEIATLFEQNAIVFGSISEAPSVVWTKPLEDKDSAEKN